MKSGTSGETKRIAPGTVPRLFFIVILAGIGLFMCISTVMYANRTNGGDGFPLDDAWIHLQFAKNLHAYGSYSYFRNEMVTSGSTSPLYTLILSLGFFVTSNEMVMSYTLGILFFLVGGVYMFKLASLTFEDDLVLAAGAAVLFLTEPRLIWVSLAGMETTLFIALLLAVTYYYKRRKAVRLGILSGLLLWARPEAILFMLILALDLVYHSFIARSGAGTRKAPLRSNLHWVRKPLLIALVIASGYFALNLWLSGTIFPNTYAAKLKYYANGGKDYPLQVFHYFTDGHFVLLAIFVLVAVAVLAARLMKQKELPLFVPVLFSIEMFLVYWKDLPYLYQEGRYLMPVLPFLILVGLDGLGLTISAIVTFFRRLKRPLRRSFALLVPVGILAGQFAVAGWEERTGYAEYCAYISARQVRTARWMHDNLPPEARIATHDVGAIAYYSERRIVDMVGLISPEMISRIGNLDGLVQFMTSKSVTHIAVLKNWFDIDNDTPLFRTDIEHPEIMEVFEYHPRTIHFLPQDVEQLLEGGRYYASLNDFTTAGKFFAQAVQRDPRSSRARTLLASALYSVGKNSEAVREFQSSLQLNPGSVDAKIGLGRVALQENRTTDAIQILESAVAASPDVEESYRLLADIYKSRRDTVTSMKYTNRADELAGKQRR